MAVRFCGAGGAGAPCGHRITGDPTRGCRGGAGRGLRLGAGERAMIATGLAQGDLGRPHRPPDRPVPADRVGRDPPRGRRGAGSTVPRRRRPRPGRPWPAPRSASWTPTRPCASGSSTRPGDRGRSPGGSPPACGSRTPMMRACAPVREQIHPGARVRPGRRRPARPVAGAIRALRTGRTRRTPPLPAGRRSPSPGARSRIPGRHPPVCARPRPTTGPSPGTGRATWSSAPAGAAP